MKYLIATILFLIISQTAFAQKENVQIEGVVTFKTSSSIYVRFADTDQIEIGDTLYVNKGGILDAALVVQKKSSSSCICESIGSNEVAVDQKIVHRKRKIPELKTQDIDEPSIDSLTIEEEVITDDPLDQILEKPKQRIKARVSLASYSFLSSEEDRDRHRTMARINLNAFNINQSKFSFESYLNYRKNFLEREVDPDYKTSFFNVYNLAVTYDADSTLRVSLGRKINRKISSLGPIDGLQAEKYFGNFYVGAVAGFRPDIVRFAFNPDLLEYGGFVGYQISNVKLYSQSTIGFLEQRNAGPLDRRYAYLQHSSTIAKNLNFFASAELDLYENIDGESSAQPRLTNLFVSSRYKMGRNLSFSLSYDARKRIIYYETFRTDVERLLADDEARQGIRSRVNFKLFKYLNGAVSYGKRFQNDNQNKSDNINAYLSYSRLPVVGGRIFFNHNRSQSNYLESNISSVRYSRTLVKKILQGNFYYRMVNYQYLSSELKYNQQFFGANFSVRISKTLRLSLLGELSSRKDERNFRINTKLIKRIDTK